MEKLVQQAIIKMATMWNPAGAIIQLIMTAWNVYQWIRENAQRIFGLVQAVVDSIANIVAGNIGGAANYIEASLAKLVPIAISLFANLLGLGGIADKIRGIIEKIQSKVDQAIDKLIARVMAMFNGKGDGKDDKADKDGKDDPRKLEEVGEPQAFISGDESHRLWATKKGASFVLMVASTPQELGSLLDSRRARQIASKDAGFAADVAQARQILDLADGSIAKIVAAARANDAAEEKRDDAALDAQMRSLVEPLKRIMIKVSTSRKPSTIAQLFQEQNATIEPGSTEAEQYGEALREKLNSMGLSIQGKAPSNAIKMMRGEDSKWTVDQGAIWAPFVPQQGAAIDALGGEAEDCAYMLSLERGGSLVQDEIESASAATNEPDHKIPKREPGGVTEQEIARAIELEYIGTKEAETIRKRDKTAYKVLQKADLRAKIDEIMGAYGANKPVRIAVAETKVSGGSVNQIVNILNGVIRSGKYPHLTFKVLALEQTMHDKDADKSQGFYRRLLNGNRIEVIYHQTEYILGEDVGYQLDDVSKQPIVVFKGVKETLTAYRITPQHETVSRDIIVDLVDGAYNGFLPGVL
jgi:hypothetical protein